MKLILTPCLQVINCIYFSYLFIASSFGATPPYPRGQIQQVFTMTEPDFNSDFLVENTVNNVQGTGGVLCRDSEYAIVSKDLVDLGISHSILFILKFDPAPTINVWTDILKLDQLETGHVIHIYKYIYIYICIIIGMVATREN